MGKITNTFNGIRKLFTGDTNAGEGFMSYLFGGVSRRSRRQLLQEYKNLVYQCITAIAEDVGRYEPIFQKKNAKGDKEAITHPFQEVLENPNPNTSQFELFEATQSFIELTGEAFWYVAVGERTRQPKELDLIRPDRVKVAIDKTDGSVAGYTVMRDDGTQIPLETDEVIHFKTFNPMNPYRGLGTVQAGLLYIETENSTSLFQHNFMKNQATPSGVLELKGNISKEAFNKVKKIWKEQQAGLANVGKTLFIRNTDAKFTKVGLSLSDIDMAALKKITEERVRGMFRVPKPLLGETDSNGLGRNNIEAIEYVFEKRVIDPKFVRIDDTLRLAARKYYKDDKLYIDHVSQIPDDKEAALAEDDKAVGRWKTANEIRKERNLDPIPGGDDLYYNFNQIPVGQNADDKSGETDKSLGRKIRLVLPSQKTAVKKDTAEDNFFSLLEKVEDKTYSQYKRTFKKLVKEQRDRLIEALASQSEKGLTQKVYDELMPNEQEEAKRFAEAVLALLLATLKTSGTAALEFIGVSDIEFAVNQATSNAVFNSTERLMRNFTRETVLKIQKQLAQGLLENESIEQLTKRIESVYSDAVGYRAERIARTEAHKAVNQGVTEGYYQAGVKKVQWRIRDAGACQYCRAMNGTIIEIGQSFVPRGGTIEGEDGGEYLNDYDDIKYADAHPNCRCELVPVRDDE